MHSYSTHDYNSLVQLHETNYIYIYIINIMHLNDTSNPNEAAFTVPFFLRTRQHVSTCPEATNESCKSCWWVFMVILAD